MHLGRPQRFYRAFYNLRYSPVSREVASLAVFYNSRDLQRQGGEGAAALYRQRTALGKTYRARTAGIVLSVIAVATAAASAVEGMAGFAIWSVVGLLIVTTAVLGRAMFYALVIPTTMPGAFFWRNEAFQAHARETGLAEMPQVGVVPEVH